MDKCNILKIMLCCCCCCCQVASFVSDSVQPHRQQPARLPCPWDSPGKNNGVGCHFLLQCMKVKSESEVTQSCPTLSDPMDCSIPGSPIPGILQARTLEWVAISFSSAWKWKVKVKSLSRVQLSATPRTTAHQAPLSMGFSRWQYWSRLPLPSPNNALFQNIKKIQRVCWWALTEQGKVYKKSTWFQDGHDGGTHPSTFA